MYSDMVVFEFLLAEILVLGSICEEKERGIERMSEQLGVVKWLDQYILICNLWFPIR